MSANALKRFYYSAFNRCKYQSLDKLRRCGLLRHLWITVDVAFGNQRLCIPIIGGIGYSNLRLSERWMLPLIKGLLQLRSGAFVDIGVNIGQSLLKIKLVHPEIPYIGFEPNPVCCFYTKQLVKANFFTNATIIPTGIGNEDSVLDLDLFASDNDTDSGASIVTDFRPDIAVCEKIPVPVFCFSSIKKYLPEVPFLVKIDVEGAELEVLESLYDTLTHDRPYVLLEILPVYSEQNKRRLERQRTLEQRIKAAEYEIFRIGKFNHSLIRLERIESIGIHGDLNACDYLLIPREHSGETLRAFQPLES